MILICKKPLSGEETLLEFSDRKVGLEELTNDVRRFSTLKDYLYIATPNARIWQERLAQTGQFKRILAQEVENIAGDLTTKDFGWHNVRQFFTALIQLGSAKQAKTVDALMQEVTTKEILRLREMVVEKKGFNSFLNRVKATPFLKV